MARMEQEYFSGSWLLPCSLRSHSIANHAQKWLTPLFGFASTPLKTRKLMSKKQLVGKQKFKAVEKLK